MPKPLIILAFFFCFLGVTTATQVNAQTAAPEYQSRNYDEKAVDHMQSNVYEYNQQIQKQESSWLRRLWMMIIEFLEQHNLGRAVNWVLWILLALLITFLAIRYFNLQPTALFKKNRKLNIPLYKEGSEQELIDHWQEAQRAEEGNEYQQAVHHLYLGVLTGLVHKQKIDWAEEKTNSQYIREIDSSLRNDFTSITLFFEKVCYGDQIPEAQTYHQQKERFVDFYQLIQKG